jgi:site-specific recombinase XerD
MARGRYAPRNIIEDRVARSAAVVTGKPDAQEFVSQIVREMRIRFYQPKSIKSYRAALEGLLRWFNQPPHRLTRDDVREFLLYLVDAGASSAWVGVNLSAIRTAFDKMCLRNVTLGLVTPRRPKTLPVVLSGREIQRLLESTPTLRDKLLLGMMYATGLRVSEVVRLRYRDLDFDRDLIRVWQGKGRKDRQVVLPKTFVPLLQQHAARFRGEDFVFPGERVSRHISPRTVQRVMKRSLQIARIEKPATPHTLRHSFAVHSFENGCDIRNIQKLLGHANLETTTIYVRVAKPTDPTAVRSPLDVANGITDITRPNPQAPKTSSRSVGNLSLHFQPQSSETADVRHCKVTIGIGTKARTIFLTGIVAREIRPGWITLEIPPLEDWDEPMRWLNREQRERIETPEFFELLQREIPSRFQQLDFG